MKRKIDSKYEIELVTRHNKIFDIFENKIEIRNIFNGNVIPEDEPLFIFRAKDKLALKALASYFCSCVMDDCTPEQIDSLGETIIEWSKWQKANLDKMKQPGSNNARRYKEA